jgi:hypothetical protein
MHSGHLTTLLPLFLLYILPLTYILLPCLLPSLYYHLTCHFLCAFSVARALSSLYYHTFPTFSTTPFYTLYASLPTTSNLTLLPCTLLPSLPLCLPLGAGQKMN